MTVTPPSAVLNPPGGVVVPFKAEPEDPPSPLLRAPPKIPLEPMPVHTREVDIINGRRTVVQIRDNDRIRFLGSSTSVGIYEADFPLIRKEQGGVMGFYGSDPKQVLSRLQRDWETVGLGFRDGMTFALMGMGINADREGRSSAEYAEGTLQDYMAIVIFLEGKAKEQGKNIRVLISGLQPQPHNRRKNDYIQLFNSKLREDPRFRDHYEAFADLSLLVTTSEGKWVKGTHKKDEKHLKPEILQRFIKTVLERTRPDSSFVDPSMKNPHTENHLLSMRAPGILRPLASFTS
jgi:hypothetical protein